MSESYSLRRWFFPYSYLLSFIYLEAPIVDPNR